MSDNKFKAKYAPGNLVKLEPPTVLIVGITFRQENPNDPDGEIKPYYDIYVEGNGKIEQGCPEEQIAGRDFNAEAERDADLATKRAAQAAFQPTDAGNVVSLARAPLGAAIGQAIDDAPDLPPAVSLGDGNGKSDCGDGS